jgi:hypothetical protein
MKAPKTQKVLITAHGYAGDAHQIRNMLPYYEHHGCPLVIFSPDDSRIEEMGPHICRFAGKREYIGALSLDRQRLQLQAMLDYPFDWFLCNDADSVVLTPELPTYLFNYGDILWSNEVSDAMHTRPPNYPWPQLAFQPPYFMSRNVAERLVQAAKHVRPDPKTPFIDWCMMAWAVQGRIKHRNFQNGISCPSNDEHSAKHMENSILRGAVFAHSIKKPDVLARMVSARKEYNRSRGRGMTL